MALSQGARQGAGSGAGVGAGCDDGEVRRLSRFARSGVACSQLVSTHLAPGLVGIGPLAGGR